MQYQVFVSHDSRDEGWANWVADAVRNVGAQPYLYEWDPQPGRDLSEKLKQEISNSALLVVILTPQSRTSADVHQEIGFAEDKTPILPIVHRDVNSDEIGFILQGREYLPLQPVNSDETFSHLIAYIDQQKQVAQEKRNRALIILAGIAGALLLGGGS